MAGDGDLLPVSALPGRRHVPDRDRRSTRSGRSPRRSRSGIPTICIDCGKCAIVCPHATIRMKVFPTAAVEAAPAEFLHKEFRSQDLPDHRLTIQVAPDDCTGCGVCVDVCPAKSKTEVAPQGDQHGAGRRASRRRASRAGTSSSRSRRSTASLLAARLGQGLAGPRAAVRVLGRVRRLRRDALHQARQPALRRPHDRGQRDRLLVDLRRQPADHAVDGRTPRAAGRRGTTRCSRTTPSSASACASRSTPRPTTPAGCSSASRPDVGADLVARVLDSRPGHRGRDRRSSASGSAALRERARRASTARSAPTPGTCSRSPATSSARASGSSAATAGPTTSASAASTTCCRPAATSTSSCSTPRCTRTPAARRRRPRRAARWPSSPPPARAPARRTSARSPASYGNVYVAQISMGANDLQTTKALLEADAWPGPSLVIAYSTCIAHGIDMSQVDEPPEGRRQERLLAALPLPPDRDRRRPAVQARLAQRRRSRSPTSSPPRPASPILERTHPERAAELAALAQADADERWRYYEQLAGDGAHRPARPSTRPGHRARRRERRRLPLRRRGGPA